MSCIKFRGTNTQATRQVNRLFGCNAQRMLHATMKLQRENSHVVTENQLLASAKTINFAPLP